VTRIDWREEAEALRDQLVAWRRDFHRHPELALQEHRSAGIIAEILDDLGYQVKTGLAETGVIGLLKGGDAGPVVMARFDMDALPIHEANDTDYVSENPGIMHACGHDGHMAVGLGVATLLAQHQDSLTGTLKLVFQPGEEGGDGAKIMVREGVLEDPRPDVALIAHIWNEKPVGTVDITPGAVMAAAERWTCTVRGKGGHGALPHHTVDPIVAASHVVSALQSVVSRNVSPLETAVVTVGSFQSGDAFNVIPDHADLSGTIRTYDAQVREDVLRRVREVIENVSAGCGASADLEITHLTPAVVNDPDVVEVVREAAKTAVGPASVTSGERTMGSEDAAYFTEQVPGCYFFVGSANSERGLDAPHHNPKFDFDEGALSIGVAVMTEAVMRYL
jgi:amidohydrolase